MVLRWRAVFPYWLSAVRVHWVLLHRLHHGWEWCRCEKRCIVQDGSIAGRNWKVDIVVLDKTGTITRGEPKVTDIIPGEGIAKDVLVRTALALELKSEHPLAKALCLWRGTEDCNDSCR